MTLPPIMPGTDERPVALTTVLPAKRRPRWVRPTVVTAGAVVLGGALLALALTRLGATHIAPLRAAVAACYDVGDLSDGDQTLFLDMEGNDPNSGSLRPMQVACILDALKAPEFILREMQQTRALDGRQSDSWGDFQASWSYHPDQGLDVLIRQVKD